MKHAALLLFATALSAATSCSRDNSAEVRPILYDALGLGNGHWEWVSSSYMSGQRTPATEGYTRQLVFQADNQLLLHRSGQADYYTGYQLSVSTAPLQCIRASTPILSFDTKEKNLGNNEVKQYTITQQQGRQVLQLAGSALCFDGGALETYYWVKE